MIICPECGQSAPDDAKFCDRCGQGLSRSAAASSSPTRPTPLAAGATLKGGIEIVELVSQTSIENRYRAKQLQKGNSATATITLRERFGPEHSEEVEQEAAPERKEAPPAEIVEDPNGPRAKTAELRPSAADKNGAPAGVPDSSAGERTTSASGAAASAEGAESGVEIESSPAPAESTDTLSAAPDVATVSEEETDAPEIHAEQTP
ncbi:MAG TPA: zinc ribbon domain-containing protein, partial [Candidatus Dormibacteraeota bacterium]|nr:zinc ribbon domain-containing protein [Candidatus Dormibacteraeota bacterium]